MFDKRFEWKASHHIHIKNPHPNSFGAFIKYKRWLASLEFMSQRDRWMQFRYKFLAEQEQHGALKCVYCGKTNLMIYCPDDWRLATIDHVMPISRGGKRFDRANLCIACTRCNQKKMSKLPLNFLWEHMPWQYKKQKETQCTLKPMSELAGSI